MFKLMMGEDQMKRELMIDSTCINDNSDCYLIAERAALH